jgi:hypothetical protein
MMSVESEKVRDFLEKVRDFLEASIIGRVCPLRTLTFAGTLDISLVVT